MAELYGLTQELLDQHRKMWKWQHNLKIFADGATFNNNETSPSLTIISRTKGPSFSTGRQIESVRPDLPAVLSGRGKYEGYIQVPVDADILGTDHLDTTPISTDGEAILIVNWNEMVLADALPLNGTILLGQYWRTNSEDAADHAGMRVFVVNGFDFDVCSL